MCSRRRVLVYILCFKGQGTVLRVSSLQSSNLYNKWAAMISVYKLSFVTFISLFLTNGSKKTVTVTSGSAALWIAAADKAGGRNLSSDWMYIKQWTSWGERTSFDENMSQEQQLAREVPTSPDSSLRCRQLRFCICKGNRAFLKAEPPPLGSHWMPERWQ